MDRVDRDAAGTGSLPRGAKASGGARLLRARRWALAAALVGTPYLAISVIWGLGGTWLLETVGGSLAVGGRAGSPIVVAAVWAAVFLKAIAVLLPFAAIRRDLSEGLRRCIRLLCVAEAIILTSYGTILTIVGLMVQSGLIEASSDADHRALAWHAFLWDPWFAAWGVLVVMFLRASRSGLTSMAEGDRPGRLVG
ncbi:hypothetical protein ABIB25_004468 [Nakamurella sp. UYEF19]|uniref:DUF3995 domain-containing protein n=1 Tax=Nakamurella sp. UYEF19 TaxID=1756392 RepID=UPI003395FFC4